MKKILFTILLLSWVFCTNAQNATAKNETIRKVSAKDVRAIMDSSSRPTILNFWATWCGPCVREIPYFDSIIAAKNAPVKLILVSLDFPESYPNKLTAFVKKQGYKGEVVYLAESDADVFIPIIEKNWTGAIPASIFLDNNKKKYEIHNSQLTRQRFALELDKLLN
jgi:thiol-disulfide isomerase/thioredoxin